MRQVLAKPSCMCSEPLYFMYRDLARSDEDRAWLHQQNLRYDLTVIPARSLCGECVKTKGHFHPKNPQGAGYPEVYEVLEGEAHYILQTRGFDDIVLVAAKAGDVVVIPPGYGHVSINPLRDAPLAMVNIVSTAFESEYGEYEARHGAAYFEMADGSMKRNPHYPHVPSLRRIRVAVKNGEKPFCNGPIYDLIGDEDALLFLNYPERYLPALSALLKD